PCRCALCSEPVASHVTSDAVPLGPALARGNGAEPVHNDVASLRTAFGVLARHYRIRPQGKSEVLALVQVGGERLGLDVEKPMAVVWRPVREDKPAPLIVLAPKEISFPVTVVGE